ncbi:MAG: helix-turn-helix transcriptional regulator [Capnocytophaga sp.]|nr:helix-turn-helix transcriptional regulator [Capnocytophaga sp.]
MNDGIEKYHFNPGFAEGFEFAGLRELLARKAEMMNKIHRAAFYQIIWFQKGSPKHFIDFQEIEIKPNTVLFVNKDAVQRFDGNTASDGKIILFTPFFFCQSEADIGFLDGSILLSDLYPISKITVGKPQTVLLDIFNQIETELKNKKDKHQPKILKNLIYNLLLLSERELLQQNFSDKKERAGLDIVLDYRSTLEKNFKSVKKVSYYAGEISVTEKKLNRAVTAILGKTAKQLIEERVMLEAKRLSVHTALSVKEIAYNLGFEEPTNFIKYFKKHSGLTPTEFKLQFSTA